MGYGFIYLLTNPSMPGLTKIGFTHKHPLARMEELTKATACPTPFEMLAYFDTPSPREAERAIHRELDEYRTNPNREFFNAPAMELEFAVRDWCDNCGGIAYLHPLEELANKEGQEEADALGKLLEERRNGTRT